MIIHLLKMYIHSTNVWISYIHFKTCPCCYVTHLFVPDPQTWHSWRVHIFQCNGRLQCFSSLSVLGGEGVPPQTDACNTQEVDKLSPCPEEPPIKVGSWQSANLLVMLALSVNLNNTLVSLNSCLVSQIVLMLAYSWLRWRDVSLCLWLEITDSYGSHVSRIMRGIQTIPVSLHSTLASLNNTPVNSKITPVSL